MIGGVFAGASDDHENIFLHSLFYCLLFDSTSAWLPGGSDVLFFYNYLDNSIHACSSILSIILGGVIHFETVVSKSTGKAEL